MRATSIAPDLNHPLSSPAEPILFQARDPSLEQRAVFARDGHLVLRGFLDGPTVDRVERWTREVTDLPEVPGRQMVYYEDSSRGDDARVLSRIENFCPYHHDFDRLLNSGPVVDMVSDLLGGPAVMFKDKINFKMPGSDGFKAHQDVQAGWDRYASLHLTVLISLDAATAVNGCLEIGSGPRRDRRIGEMWAPLDEDDPDIRYELCPTEPGDAVVFDSFVPHRSKPNTTDQPRRALYVTYNLARDGDQRAQYYADKRESYPPDCERSPDKQYVYRV